MTIFELLGNPEYKNKMIIEKITCYFLEISKEDLFKKYDEQIPEDKLETIKEAYIDYTVNKKPLEFIFGHVEFLENRFIVNENTLIPRPETEYMITSVNDFIENSVKNGSLEGVPYDQNPIRFNIMDLGTGCGVLGTSVLYFNSENIDKSYLSDLSGDALVVAKQNHARLTEGKITNTTFLESDLMAYLFDEENKGIFGCENPSVIVANLPYIPENTFDTEVEDNVKKWEPRMAFVGGDDGLDLYRVMFNQIFQALQYDKAAVSKANQISFQVSPKIKERLLKIEKHGENIDHELSEIENREEQKFADENTDYSIKVQGTNKNIFMFLETTEWQVEILEKEYGHIFNFEPVATFHFNIKIVKVWFK